MLQAYQKASRMSSKPASWHCLACKISENKTTSLPFYGKPLPSPILGRAGVQRGFALQQKKRRLLAEPAASLTFATPSASLDIFLNHQALCGDECLNFRSTFFFRVAVGVQKHHRWGGAQLHAALSLVA